MWAFVSRDKRQLWAYLIWAMAAMLLTVSVIVLYAGDCNDHAPGWVPRGFVGAAVFGCVAAFVHQWHRIWLALALALSALAVAGVAWAFTLAAAFANKCAS